MAEDEGREKYVGTANAIEAERKSSVGEYMQDLMLISLHGQMALLLDPASASTSAPGRWEGKCSPPEVTGRASNSI